MVCNVITADKANRLFWLGRYAERVYISLHLLRRYYDMVLDGDTNDLTEYYSCLGIAGNASDRDFQITQLYDLENICSIATSMAHASDNAIVLRRDITSESLSYIQMSQALIDKCSRLKEKNITLLQPVTDNMLAFFGSIDERVFDKRVRAYLKMGKFIENLDLHIRFNYQFFRIEEVYDTLKEHIERIDAQVDGEAIKRLDALLTEEQYAAKAPGYKELILGYINTLVTV